MVKRYEYEVELVESCPTGKGGTSDVWKGKLTRSNEKVAVKLPLPGKREEGSRKQEARIWAFLDHPNISPFHGFHYVNGQPALVAPWYDNGTANVYLKRNSESSNARRIIRQITEGIAYLHSRGIVHGDLKGDNVMVDDDGHARIIDFGHSQSLTPELPIISRSSNIAYSLRWCAPELQLFSDSRPTYASDVYSWACTVLELLTGEKPYSGIRDIDVFQYKHIPPPIQAKALRYDVKDPGSLWKLLDRCWGAEDTRPSIYEIQDQLRYLL